MSKNVHFNTIYNTLITKKFILSVPSPSIPWEFSLTLPSRVAEWHINFGISELKAFVLRNTSEYAKIYSHYLNQMIEPSITSIIIEKARLPMDIINRNFYFHNHDKILFWKNRGR